MTSQKHDFGISDQGELWGNPLGHIGGPNAQIPSRIDAEAAEPEITYFMNCPAHRTGIQCFRTLELYRQSGLTRSVLHGTRGELQALRRWVLF